MKDIDNLPLSAFMPHHPSDDPHAPFTAKAGKKNNNCNKKIKLFEVVEALETVYDPEIPVDIYELGLIYDVFVNEDNNVKILMTLTTPNCPVAETLPVEVEDKVKSLKMVNDAEVEITFDPPWTQDLMSEEAKLELGML